MSSAEIVRRHKPGVGVDGVPADVGLRPYPRPLRCSGQTPSGRFDVAVATAGGDQFTNRVDVEVLVERVGVIDGDRASWWSGQTQAQRGQPASCSSAPSARARTPACSSSLTMRSVAAAAALPIERR